MLSCVGFAVSRVFERTAPDPFVIAVLLTVVTATLCVTLGFEGVPVADRPAAVLDAWFSGEGLWTFLAFGMQMCLVLVTGHALAESGPVRALLARVASAPAGPASAAALVAGVGVVLGLVNWGLGLIAGALVARDVGRKMAERGIAVHYPLLAAAGYSGLLVWHGGLSGSAPLTMTTPAGAAAVLPAGAVDRFGGGVPLAETLFSPLNLIATGGLVVIVPVVYALLSPRRPGVCRGVGSFEPAAPAEASDARPRSLPEHLDRSRVVAGVLVAALAAGVARYVVECGAGRLGLNEINAAMLALGLALHGSPRRYLAAVEEGARGCAGIIIQFPLYGGVIGMLSASGLIERFAAAVASGVGPTLLPVATAASAAVVNLFVPSGGGQWGIQGPIALEAGAAVGVRPGTMIMAVAYGDQLTNMLQPFWALPLLAITGCRAREIVGFTAVVMVISAVWIGLCLVLLAS